MWVELLKEIDKNNDFTITQKELNNFLETSKTKESDIKEVAEELKKNNKYIFSLIEKWKNQLENQIENSKAIFTEEQKELSWFVEVMREKMTASADYPLYKKIMQYIDTELINKAQQQFKKCKTQEEYQQLVINIAKNFNGLIRNNGQKYPKNPAYNYFSQNTIAPNLAMVEGTNPLGTDQFIAFGNILWDLCDAEKKADLDKVKWIYYSMIRKAKWKRTVLWWEQGREALWTFSQDKSMTENLQADVLNSQEMEKYPDLKIIKDFFINLKTKLESWNTSMLWLREQFEKIKVQLAGKMSPASLKSLEETFNKKFADIDKEVKTIYSEESTTQINTMVAMQWLGIAIQMTGAKFSEEDLVKSAEYYKKNKKFTPAAEIKLKGAWVDLNQIYTYINKTALDSRIRYYNTALANRLEAYMLHAAISSDPQRADKLYTDSPLFKVYNDVYGIGERWWRSDDRLKWLKNIADQLIINIAITAFSGWLGSAAAGALFKWIAAKTIGGKVALFCAKMIVEWSVFHATNTLLTGAVSGDRNTMLNELKHPAWWAKSILYMGVMKGVGKALNMAVMGPASKLPISQDVLQTIAKWLQLPLEIGGMMVTDQVISLTFNQQLQDVTLESFLQTVTLVVGLKLAHKIVPMSPEKGDITSDKVYILWMKKQEWVVTDISYKQKIMKTIDQKVDYLAGLLKIKSSLRADTAINILNSMNVAFKQWKLSQDKYQQHMKNIETCIDNLKQEGKQNKKLEEKYEAMKKRIENTEVRENKNTDTQQIESNSRLMTDNSEQAFLQIEKELAIQLTPEEKQKIQEIHGKGVLFTENKQVNIAKYKWLIDLFKKRFSEEKAKELSKYLMEKGRCGKIADLAEIENKIEWKSKPKRNTTKQEMHEVQREHTIMAIGDLHGDYKFFIDNMIESWLIKQENGELIRTGGDTHVQFLWDILGDRWVNGMKIIETIAKLRHQAREKWGDIGNIIDGNHDYFFKSFLAGDMRVFKEALEIQANNGLFVDVMKYVSSDKKWQALIDIMQSAKSEQSSMIEQYKKKYPEAIGPELETIFSQTRKEKMAADLVLFAISKMWIVEDTRLLDFAIALKKWDNSIRNNPDIIKFFEENRSAMVKNIPLELREELTSAEILQQRDDALFLHTPPTERIVQMIVMYAKKHGNNIGKAIDEINSIYQEGLQYWAKLRNTQQRKNEYNQIRDVFLDTENRSSTQHEWNLKYLREHGINRIVNGHQPQEGTKDLAWIEQYSVDVWRNGTHAFSRIEKTNKQQEEIWKLIKTELTTVEKVVQEKWDILTSPEKIVIIKKNIEKIVKYIKENIASLKADLQWLSFIKKVDILVEKISVLLQKLQVNPVADNQTTVIVKSVESLVRSYISMRVKFVKQLPPTEHIVEQIAWLWKEERITMAQSILEKTLETTEIEAILTAHEIWSNREWAKIYNYTRSEIRQKVKILREAGFDKVQRRLLLESGVCGKITQRQITVTEEQMKSYEQIPTEQRWILEEFPVLTENILDNEMSATIYCKNIATLKELFPTFDFTMLKTPRDKSDAERVLRHINNIMKYSTPELLKQVGQKNTESIMNENHGNQAKLFIEYIQEIHEKYPDIPLENIKYEYGGRIHPNNVKNLISLLPSHTAKEIFTNETLLDAYFALDDGQRTALEILPEYMVYNILTTTNLYKKRLKWWVEATEWDSVKREKILEEFKEFRKTSKETIALLPDQIIEYFDIDPKATAKEAIQSVYEQIKNLDGAVQIDIVQKIRKYKRRIEAIERYINKSEYKNNPARLLWVMRGFDYKILNKPKEISMERIGSNIVFYVADADDYKRVYNPQRHESQEESAEKSGWFATEASEIIELRWTLNVVKNNKEDKQATNTKIHENRHTLNKYLFTEKEESPTKRAKDEILAYLKDGTSRDRIYRILSERWWLYDYFKKDGMDPNSAKYAESRANHEAMLEKSLDIAKALKDAEVPNYLDILSITDIKQRGKLAIMYKDEIYISQLQIWLTREEKKINIEIKLSKNWEIFNENIKDLQETFEYVKARWEKMTGKKRWWEKGVQTSWETNTGKKLLDHIEILIESESQELAPGENLSQKMQLFALLKRNIEKLNIPLIRTTELATKFAKNFKEFVREIKLLFARYPKIVAEIDKMNTDDAGKEEIMPQASIDEKGDWISSMFYEDLKKTNIIFWSIGKWSDRALKNVREWKKSENGERWYDNIIFIDVNAGSRDHHNNADGQYSDVCATDLVWESRDQITEKKEAVISHQDPDLDSITSYALYVMIKKCKIENTPEKINNKKERIGSIIKYVNACDLWKYKELQYDKPDLSYVISEIMKKTKYIGTEKQYAIWYEIINRVIEKEIDVNNIKVSDFEWMEYSFDYKDPKDWESKQTKINIGEIVNDFQKNREINIKRFEKVKNKSTYMLENNEKVFVGNTEGINLFELYNMWYSVIIKGKSIYFNPAYVQKERTIALSKELENAETKKRQELYMVDKTVDQRNNGIRTWYEMLPIGHPWRNANPWNFFPNYTYLVQPKWWSVLTWSEIQGITKKFFDIK